MINYMVYQIPRNVKLDKIGDAAVAAARNDHFSIAYQLCFYSKSRSANPHLTSNMLLDIAIEAGNMEMALLTAHLDYTNYHVVVDDIPDFIKSKTTDEVIAFLEEANRQNRYYTQSLVRKILQSAIKRNHLDLIDRLLNEHYPNIGLDHQKMIEEIAIAALVVGSDQLVWKGIDRIVDKVFFVNYLLEYSGYLGRINVIREIVEVRFPDMAKRWNYMRLLREAASKGNWNVVRYIMEMGDNINWNDRDYLKSALGYAVQDGQFEIVKFLHEKLYAYLPYSEAFHSVYLKSLGRAKTARVFGALDGILKLYTNEAERQELIFEAVKTALRLEEPEHATWAIGRLSAASIESRFNDDIAEMLLNPNYMQATIQVIYKSIKDLELAREFLQVVRSYWDQETDVFKPPTLISMQQLFLITPWQAMPISIVQSFARAMLDSPWYRQIAKLDEFMMPNLMHLGLGAMKHHVETKESDAYFFVGSRLTSLPGQAAIDVLHESKKSSAFSAAPTASEQDIALMTAPSAADATAQDAGAGTEDVVDETKGGY